MGFVTGFVDVIVQPLEEAAGKITQLSKDQREANGRLQRQGLDLTTTFGGKGANAFLTMVQKEGRFVTGIAANLDEVSNIFTKGAQLIQDAAQVADWALGGPLLDLAERVLSRLSPPLVVRNGESAVYAITSDMRRTFGQLLHHSGGVFSDLAHLHVGAALHQAEHALGDLAHLGEDLFALLDQVETILGKWAAKVMEAANWLTNQIQRVSFKVENFVLGISEIDENAAIIADPNSTPEEIALASASIGITVLGDVLLFVPGAEEGKLVEEGGDLAMREAESAAEKEAAKLLEDEAEQQIEHQVETLLVQDGDKMLLSHLETTIVQDGDNVFLQKLELILLRDGDKTLLYKVESRVELTVEEDLTPQIEKEGDEAIAEEESNLAKFQRLSNRILNGDLITINPQVHEMLDKGLTQITDWSAKHGLQLLYGEGKAKELLDGTGTKLVEKIVREKSQEYLSKVVGGPLKEYAEGKIDEYELHRKIDALTQQILNSQGG